MYTSSTSSEKEFRSAFIKINDNSVMLYRNGYINGAEGKSGMSVQQYICSFSTRKTEIPLYFHDELHRATTGQPELYQALMEKIQTRVLEPARRYQQEQEQLEQLKRLKGYVNFAKQQIQDAAAYVYRDNIHLGDPEIQQGIRLLLQDVQVLLIQPKHSEASNSINTEQKLQQLLDTINDACAEVQKMLPVVAQNFCRGYKFENKTVEKVQQLWFSTSDAVATLNQRQQLKRPNNWSTTMRP